MSCLSPPPPKPTATSRTPVHNSQFTRPSHNSQDPLPDAQTCVSLLPCRELHNAQCVTASPTVSTQPLPPCPQQQRPARQAQTRAHRFSDRADGIWKALRCDTRCKRAMVATLTPPLPPLPTPDIATQPTSPPIRTAMGISLIICLCTVRGDRGRIALQQAGWQPATGVRPLAQGVRWRGAPDPPDALPLVFQSISWDIVYRRHPTPDYSILLALLTNVLCLCHI